MLKTDLSGMPPTMNLAPYIITSEL